MLHVRLGSLIYTPDMIIRRNTGFPKGLRQIVINTSETGLITGSKFRTYRFVKRYLDSMPQYKDIFRMPLTHYAKRVRNIRTIAEDMLREGKKVVIKPPNKSGMRGLRIITPNHTNNFFESKPMDIEITLEDLYSKLGERFSPLLVMDFLPGKEWSVDCFGYYQDEQYHCIVIPRTREEIRTGITFSGIVKYNEKIIEICKKIAQDLKIEYVFGFQFIEREDGVPIIIEANPRIQGTMVMSTLAGANLIYLGVKYALSEKIPPVKIKWGTKFWRYWGGIGITADGITNIGCF